MSNVHHEYVSETAVTTETNTAPHINQELKYTLVDKARFHELTNLDTNHWDNLFGNNRENDNPNVSYLTEDSCNKINQHIMQFFSGIDFQHLPAGFMLVKNPSSGVCDVLHYDEFYAQLQPEDANNVLAVTLVTNEELSSNSEECMVFDEPQNTWFKFLHEKCESFCTQSQLEAAFMRFSEILKEKQLAFFKTEFDECLKISGNPIVLLGRWETVLSNPHLKLDDLEEQWHAIPKLPLIKSCGAIRAITDYMHDNRPCGFIIAEMDVESFFERPTSISRNELFLDSDFWRNIAYQPKRNSINFYKQSLKELKEIVISSFEDPNFQSNPEYLGKKNYIDTSLKRILIATTVEYNHCAKNPAEELGNLDTWSKLCKALVTPDSLTTTVAIIQRDLLIEYTWDLVKELDNLSVVPSMDFLDSVLLCLINLRNGYNIFKAKVVVSKINLLVANLGRSFYRGAKFYFINKQWNSIDINQYLELQYELYTRCGGRLKVFFGLLVGPNNQKTDPRNYREYLPLFSLLAPHLSTFNIKIGDIPSLIANSSQYNFYGEKLYFLEFCFDFLHDIQNNNNLSTSHATALINHVMTLNGNWQLNIIDYLAKNFAQNFAPNYFENKRNILLNGELTSEQKSKLTNCHFQYDAFMAISCLEAEIAPHKGSDLDTYLDDLHNSLLSLKLLFNPNDFISFCKKLAAMSACIAQNSDTLLELIYLITSKRTLEGFNQIFVRNDIEKSQQNLLKKFMLYIDKIKTLADDKDIQLNKLLLQETLTTLVLNLEELDDFEQTASKLIKQLSNAASGHPHIKTYLLDCLNHLPGKESKEYLQHIISYGDAIEKLTHYLPADAQENMLTIYSLLAHFHKKPTELCELVSQDICSNMLQFISRLLDNQQSYQGYAELSQDACDMVLSKKPPYPNIETINQWVADNSFEENYAAFEITPYGERQLGNAFSLEQYHSQATKFDLDDLFTQAIGNLFNQRLSANRSKSLQQLRDDYNESKNKEDKIDLICLCIEILARTTWQQSSHGKISQELNTTQVMALYAMIANQSKHIISQIDTGEGKSRVMMVMAACQAAQGKTVDFSTSNMSLTEREYLSYRQFFTALDIPTSLISLDTPCQLYQKNGVNFTDNTQLLLLRNKSDIDGTPFAYQNEDASLRCLLIDEVDTFIHDKSQDSYNYAAQSEKLSSFVWIYPHLVDFVALSPQKSNPEAFLDYIKTNVINLREKASLVRLNTENPEQIKIWLRSALKALNMRENIEYIKTAADNLYLLRDSEGSRYSRKIIVFENGRQDQGSSFSDGVHQCLCAKENKKHPNEFIIVPENATIRASYTASFLQKYNKGAIYGVSGTTRSAAQKNPAINHKKYTYLTVPREKTLIRQDKQTWLAKDEQQQIEFLKRSILKAINAGHPVLLVCKDDAQSARLHDALQLELNHVNLQRLHGLTSKAEESSAIQQAGQANFVTISTAGMLGRGVDIPASHLVVLAAYIPTAEDEIQIKGRTGRIGKPGEYRMIPNMSDTDYPINGYTYNVTNEVLKSQQQRAKASAFQEEISSLYAFFLEHITENFLADWKNCADEDRETVLIEWQEFLSAMQKDWGYCRQELLAAVEAEDSEEFANKFTAFIERHEKNGQSSEIKYTPDIDNHYKAIMAYKSFFAPSSQPLYVQRDYDPSDDGQARIYSTLFAKTRATLRGERRLFADFHAWREGRGCLFPDLMAVLKGERQLFANLYATIARWLAEWSEWLNARNTPVELACVS